LALSETVEQLTLFPPDTHASLLVLPGSDEARKMTATSGRKLSESLRKSGPVGLLAKMLLGTSLWGSTTSYLTWKTRATPRKRLLFRLVPSVQVTDEIGSSLWPTPHANCHTGAGEKGEGGMNTQTAVKMWPTPTTNDAKNATLPPAAQEWDIIPGALMREGHSAKEGQLNPEWVEVLMCFPIGWTEV